MRKLSVTHTRCTRGEKKKHGVLLCACFSACEGKMPRCVLAAAAEVSSKPGRGSQITRRCFLLLQSLPVEWGSALSTFGATASRTGCHTDPRRGKKGRRPFQGALFSSRSSVVSSKAWVTSDSQATLIVAGRSCSYARCEEVFCFRCRKPRECSNVENLGGGCNVS